MPDNRSVPERVSDHFQFKLDVQIVTNAEGDPAKVYSAVDWVMGVTKATQRSVASFALKRLRNDTAYRDELICGTYTLKTIASDGKLRQSVFLTERLLYALTMKLRLDTDRKSEIEKFLSKSGEFVSMLSNNPALALEIPLQQLHSLYLGKGETPEQATKHVKLRANAIVVRNKLTNLMKYRYVSPQKWYYGALTNRMAVAAINKKSLNSLGRLTFGLT